MKNDNGVFATTEEISPVKVSVGEQEMYVYNSTEGDVWSTIQSTFGIKAKRSYKKFAPTTSWGGEDKPKRTYTRKTEKEAVTA